MLQLEENNPSLRSFIEVDKDSSFSIQNLPFGIFHLKNDNKPRAGVAIGDMVLDLAEIMNVGLFDATSIKGMNIFAQATLNDFMSLGRLVCREVRSVISKLLRHDEPLLRDNLALRKKALHHKDNVIMLLPVHVGGYTDFYSSIEHARNVGIMFRDKDNPLLPNWLHLPVGYDGRASSIVVSGTNFRRPMGQLKPNNELTPIYDECKQLDTEVEVAFIVGKSNNPGEQITVDNAAEYVFGMVLLSDWSARDIQRWEYVPLGPFLGKNFCTSISAWVVTMDALEPFRTKSCEQSPVPLKYLQSTRDWSYDINLEMTLKTAKMEYPQRICLTNYKSIYWDYCQQLAHHTSGGCTMKSGDIFASGTISGADKSAYGSLLEITWGGTEPIKLSTGEERKFMLDYDTISIGGWCQGNGYRVGFGEVVGQVLPSLKVVDN